MRKYTAVFSIEKAPNYPQNLASKVQAPCSWLESKKKTRIWKDSDTLLLLTCSHILIHISSLSFIAYCWGNSSWKTWAHILFSPRTYWRYYGGIKSCVCYMQFWKTAFEDSGRFLGTDWQGPGTHVSGNGALLGCFSYLWSPLLGLVCTGLSRPCFRKCLKAHLQIFQRTAVQLIHGFCGHSHDPGKKSYAYESKKRPCWGRSVD